MKNNATAQVKIYEDHAKKQQFLIDSKSNIFVVFQNRILPLHKDVVFSCSYFRQNDYKQEKVIFLEDQIDASGFFKVLAALYGYSLDFVRGAEGIKIFQAAMLLGVEKIVEFFQKDFENNFQQYGIFSLYNVAKKYKLEWLEEKCLNDLITCQFQQFRINKYDLMNSTKETFQQVLKQHQILKSRGLTQGIQEQKVKSLIEQYSSLNSTEVDVQDVFSLTQSCDQVTQKLLESVNDQKQKTRKRKLTWNCPSYISGISTELELEFNSNLKILPQKNSEEKEKEQSKVSDLSQINSTIIEKSNIMITQIRQAQVKASSSDVVSQQKMERLNKKLAEMASIFQKQEQKIAKTKQIALQIQKRNGRKNLTFKF